MKTDNFKLLIITIIWIALMSILFGLLIEVKRQKK